MVGLKPEKSVKSLSWKSRQSELWQLQRNQKKEELRTVIESQMVELDKD